jgi:hypothetical protein
MISPAIKTRIAATSTESLKSWLLHNFREVDEHRGWYDKNHVVLGWVMDEIGFIQSVLRERQETARAL